MVFYYKHIYIYKDETPEMKFQDTDEEDTTRRFNEMDKRIFAMRKAHQVFQRLGFGNDSSDEDNDKGPPITRCSTEFSNGPPAFQMDEEDTASMEELYHHIMSVIHIDGLTPEKFNLQMKRRFFLYQLRRLDNENPEIQEEEDILGKLQKERYKTEKLNEKLGEYIEVARHRAYPPKRANETQHPSNAKVQKYKDKAEQMTKLYNELARQQHDLKNELKKKNGEISILKKHVRASTYMNDTLQHYETLKFNVFNKTRADIMKMTADAANSDIFKLLHTMKNMRLKIAHPEPQKLSSDEFNLFLASMSKLYL